MTTSTQKQQVNVLATDRLKDRKLYAMVLKMLEHLVEQQHDPEVQTTLNMYNPQSPWFSPRDFLRIIGGVEYVDQIFTTVDARTMSHLMSRIYNLKGTRKGLRLVLKLLDPTAEAYIWWEVLRARERGQPLAAEFESRFPGIPSSQIKPCSIYVYYEGMNEPGGNPRVDAVVWNLTRLFAWVCADISLSSVVNFRDTIPDLTDSLVSLYETVEIRDEMDAGIHIKYNAQHQYDGSKNYGVAPRGFIDDNFDASSEDS